MTQAQLAPVDVQRAHDLENNAQITAAGRFWQLCLAQEMSADPSLRPNKTAPTFLDNRRVLSLIGSAGARVVRLIFGVVLRDVTHKPEIFTPAVATLANSMAFEIGDSLSSFPFEERVRILQGLTAKMAEGLQIGLAAAEEPAAVQ